MGLSSRLRGADAESNLSDALVLAGLTKTFRTPAVDRLDLTVRAGELYALLGPNGAGKTTTLRMVAGLLKPDAGAISVFGIDALAEPTAAKRLIAWALIHDPKLLILDEPLTGLDAAVARQVKDLLQARVDGGATVILTTHILEVAERMADRIGIIQGGRLLAEGTLDELRARTGEQGASLEDVFLDLTTEEGSTPA